MSRKRDLFETLALVPQPTYDRPSLARLQHARILAINCEKSFNGTDYP
jgi:hypothetical protein